MSKMSCKYCHLTTHYIDKCPTIICKNCKKVGHPLWLCSQSKPNKKNNSNNTKPNDNKFALLSDEFSKKKSNDNINYKTISSYNKLVDVEWGSLVD